jgi:hypothetical protein
VSFSLANLAPPDRSCSSGYPIQPLRRRAEIAKLIVLLVIPPADAKVQAARGPWQRLHCVCEGIARHHSRSVVAGKTEMPFSRVCVLGSCLCLLRDRVLPVQQRRLGHAGEFGGVAEANCVLFKLKKAKRGAPIWGSRFTPINPCGFAAQLTIRVGAGEGRSQLVAGFPSRRRTSVRAGNMSSMLRLFLVCEINSPSC